MGCFLFIWRVVFFLETSFSWKGIWITWRPGVVCKDICSQEHIFWSRLSKNSLGFHLVFNITPTTDFSSLGGYNPRFSRASCSISGLKLMIIIKKINISGEVFLNNIEAVSYTIECLYLKCTVWEVLTYVYTHKTITAVKVTNTSITPKVFLCYFYNPLLTTSPSPSKHCLVFCYCRLFCVS